jgi:hypothetical protein
VGNSTFETIVAGVTVYVVGQIVKAVFVDPIMEQRRPSRGAREIAGDDPTLPYQGRNR